MSKQVDSRVVEMQFDNSNFERNVQTSMSTLDKLKKSLNLDGASKGLDNINNSAKKVNMSGIGSAVDAVKVKFSALQVAAVAALTNITNSAVNAGKRMVSALTIDPIKTGFNEYETKIGSIQTIMSNTASKGTTMADVTQTLDELNTYADKTIYNFAEMTRNIGTFTAAGVGLKESATAIQGIANLAAASGSNSQQASTAMYQLSQALAAGTVKLMDWNSVVNAGMGGEKFQEALKETARRHGVAVDEMIEKNGSFRESLQEGWISAEILNETLSNFTVKGATEYSKAMMESGKWTQEQADAFVAEAQSMEDAATKVKTFTQLWDTLKESAQSGWAQSWEIIIGNFEEARNLFTNVSDTIGQMISDSANARNEMLQGWKDLGGRDVLIDSLKNAFEGLMSIVAPIKQAFSEIFPPITAQQLLSFTEKLRDLTANFKISETTANNLKRTFKGVFSVFDIVRQGVTALGKGFMNLVGFAAPAGEGILGITAKIGDFLTGINEAIKSTGIFNTVVGGITKIAGFVTSAISRVVHGISNLFTGLNSDGIGAFIGKLQERFRSLTDFFGKIGEALGNVKDKIVESIKGSNFNGIADAFNTGLFAVILLGVRKLIKKLSSIASGGTGILAPIKDLLNGVKECLEAWQSSLKANTLLKIAAAVGILAASLIALSLIDSKKLTSALVGMTVSMGELVGALALIQKISAKGDIKGSAALISMAVSVAILASAISKLSNLNWKELAVGLTGMTVALGEIVGAMKLLQVIAGGGKLKSVTPLITMALSLVILASALQKLASIPWKNMIVALGAMTVALGEMVGAMKLLQMIAGRGKLKSLTPLVTMALSLVILASALQKLAGIPWKNMAVALGAMTVALGEMVGAMKLLQLMAGRRKLKSLTPLITMALSLVVMASALQKLAGIPWKNMVVALGAMTLALGEMVGAMKLLQMMAGRGKLKSLTPLITMALSLVVMASTLQNLASIPWKNMVVALGAMTIALGEMVGAMKLLQMINGNGSGSLKNSASMLLMASSILVLVGAMKAMAGLSWEGIAKGLAAIGGALVLIGGAGAALSFVPGFVPTVLALGGAIALIGVGCLAAGAGITALAGGLAALGAAFAVDGAAITAAIAALLDIIPILFQKIGEGIVAAAVAIGNGASSFVEAFTKIMLALLTAIRNVTPQIIDTLLNIILTAITSLANYAPLMAAAGIQLIIGLLQGIAAGVGPIVEAAANVITNFLTAIGENIPRVVEAGLSVVTALANGIGSAIGGAVGSIIGGFAKSFMNQISEQFSQIGTDLSGFMTDIQPFIDGIKNVDSSVLEGAKNLSLAILALTGANFLEKIASFVTGRTSMSDFAKQLVPLAEGLVSFGDAIAPLTEESISKISLAANAGKALAELQGSLEPMGGVADFFAGSKDFSSFSEGIKSFGSAIVEFSSTVSSIDESAAENITRAVNAGRALAELNDMIPNLGGVVSWFTGDNDFTAFSVGVRAFGVAISGFSTSVSNIDDSAAENITRAVNAGRALAELNDMVPNLGGVVGFFTGENDFTTFSVGVNAFGGAISGFSTSVSNIDESAAENIARAVNAGRALAELNDMIPNLGGVVGFFAGENDFTTFSSGVTSFGEAIKGFSVDEAAGENINRAISAARSIANLSNITINTENLETFGDNIKTFGKKIGDYCKSVSSDNVSPDAVRESAFAVQTIAGVAGSIPDTENLISFGENLTDFGDSVSDYMEDIKDVDAGQISSATQAIVDMVNSLSNLDTSGINESAVNFVSNFISAIQSNAPQAQSAGSNLGQNVAFGLQSASSSASASGATVGQAGASGANGQSGAYSSIGSLLGFMIASGLLGSSGTVSGAGSSTAGFGASGAQGQSGMYSSTGNVLGNGLAGGLLGSSGMVSSAGSSVGQSGASGARGSIGGWSSIGSSMASGLASGILGGASLVISAAVSIASRAITAAKNALEINSPSKAFMALGNSIGEGLAKGIYESTWMAVHATEDSTQRIKDVAAKSFEDVEEWIETAKHFDELTKAEELQIWESIIPKYAEGSEEWLKANKNAYTVAKEIRDQNYQDAVDYIDKEKDYHRMSIDEEIAAYEELLVEYADYAEKREEIEDTLYDLKHEKIDGSVELLNEEIAKQEELLSTIEEGTEAYRVAFKELEYLKGLQKEASLQDGEDWIAEQKAYDRLSPEEELAAYYRQLAKTTEGSEEYKDILQDIYDLKVDMSDGDVDFIKKEIEAYDELIATLQEGTPEYENACKDRLNWQKRLTDALLQDSEKWMDFRDKYGRAGGLSEELADNMRVLRRTITETPWDTDTIEEYRDNVYDVMKEIYDANEQYQDDVKKAQDDYEQDRIDLEQEKADKIKEINEQLQQDIAEADAEYYDELESRTKSLYDAYGLFDEVSKKEEVNPETLMKNLQDQVDEFNDWSDLLDQLSGRGLNADLVDELQEMGPSAIAEIRALTKMSDSELQQYATLWSTKHEEAKNRATAELEDLRIETDSKIKALQDQADKDLDDYVKKTWQPKMDELNENLNKSLEELKDNFEKSVGIVKTDTIQQFNEMKDTAISIMRDAGWDEMGQEIVSGLVSGLENNSDQFTSAIKSLWNKGQAAFQAQGEINSPSKVFIRLGKFIDQGLAIGLRDYGSIVSNASSDLGQNTIDSMSDAIGRVSDVINGNIDIDPTIRPVLDLTDITNGLNQMDTAFMANRSMRLGMEIAGGIQNGNSSMDNLFSKIADSNAQSSGRITEAIDSLKSDFANLVDKVSHLQMVVDSGALVGAIAPQVDRKLNTISVMKRRGN